MIERQLWLGVCCLELTTLNTTSFINIRTGQKEKKKVYESLDGNIGLTK